jgi:hypothetical protein
MILSVIHQGQNPLESIGKTVFYKNFVWLVYHSWITLKKNSMVWVRERTIPTERPPLVGEVIATSADRGCHVVSVTDPYDRILGFLDRSRYFSVKKLLSCTHKAEWTPFQTHYFFFFFWDNLINRKCQTGGYSNVERTITTQHRLNFVTV